MSRLDELYEEYRGRGYDELDKKQMDDLYARLPNIGREDIKSCPDAEKYLDVLEKYRRCSSEFDKYKGSGYRSFIRKTLSNGDDSMYLEAYHYIYELIQNVDDCDYADPSDCRLDMTFDRENDTVTLTYNETGFTPFNVYAITGIAEQAKGMLDGKLEIGEKGIGFKSVFGVADMVRIRSGFFSFEIDGEDFTVPMKSYGDGFDRVRGTELVLYLSDDMEDAGTIYDGFVERYSSEDALFNKNPVLFLNKLTEISMTDGVRTLRFHVDRDGTEAGEGLAVEEGVRLSAVLSGSGDGDFVREMRCVRFTMNVPYDRDDYVSRYGPETQYAKSGCRPMPVHAVVPEKDSLYKLTDRHGTLYSFLPTRVRLNAPMAVHAPFKLTANRERVDYQKGNKWFGTALAAMKALLNVTYDSLSDLVGTDIMRYLPDDVSFVDIDTDDLPEFSNGYMIRRGSIYERRIFPTDDGKKTAGEIVCIDSGETDDPRLVNEILGTGRSVFDYPRDLDPVDYGIERMSGLNEKILERAFNVPSSTRAAMDYLSGTKWTGFKVDFAVNLSVEQIEAFAGNDRFRDAMKDNSLKKIKAGGVPAYAAEKPPQGFLKVHEAVPEYGDGDIPDGPIHKYLFDTMHRCVAVDSDRVFFIPMRNALVLSRGADGSCLGAFSAFCSETDPGTAFSLKLRITDAMNALNGLTEDDSMPDDVYLQKLREDNGLVKAALDNSYGRIIMSLAGSGADRERFIDELLQNADDNEYDEGCVPTFELKAGDGTIETYCNEKGFRKKDVRAITSIGDSTKAVLAAVQGTTGEKGVGFKSVFNVADSVRIDSGRFHFSLGRATPTIPEVDTGCGENTEGTRMRLAVNAPRRYARISSVRDVLGLVLCLRRLKKITLGGFRVEITDRTDADGKERRDIDVNGTTFSFKKWSHPFTVKDDEALKERAETKPGVRREQCVCCYLCRKGGVKGGTDVPEHLLYCGLPTDVKVNDNLYIDAPFELTTSRDKPKDSLWNKEILAAVYDAVAEVIVSESRDVSVPFTELSLLLREIRDPDAARTDYRMEVFTGADELNRFDWMGKLRKTEFLRTYDPDVFVSPDSGCRRYPAVADFVVEAGKELPEPPSRILRVPAVKDYDPLFKALGCEEPPAKEVTEAVAPYVGEYMTDGEFRRRMYSFMRENPSSSYRNLPVVPVLGRREGGEREFVCWDGNEIYTKKGAASSSEEYLVLDEGVCRESDLGLMLDFDRDGTRLQEMTPEVEEARYQKKFRDIVLGSPDDEAYQFMLNEYDSGNMDRHDVSVLMEVMYARGELPLKNKSGEITRRRLFIDTSQEGYFNSAIIREISISRECEAMAGTFCRSDRYALCVVRYEDIPFQQSGLTDDEIEELMDRYFRYRWEILRGYVGADRITDDQIEKYRLGFLVGVYHDGSGVVEDGGGKEYDYDFPVETVKDADYTRNRLRKRFDDPQKIVRLPVPDYTVPGVEFHGAESPMPTSDLRNMALRRYSVSAGRSVCQMCKCAKRSMFMEVNNIEHDPEYLWYQTRVCLCLDCSKRFEEIRNNDGARGEFRRNLLAADYSAKEPSVPVPGGGEMYFTELHLFEIQEILKWEDARGED